MRKISGMYSEMKRKGVSLLLAFALLFGSAVVLPPVTAVAAPVDPRGAVIPKPAMTDVSESGIFQLTEDSKIFVYADDATDLDTVKGVAEYLRNKLSPATGFSLPAVTNGTPAASDIVLKTIPKAALLSDGVDYAKARGIEGYGAEGYRLDVNGAGLQLSAYEPEGLFRGIQTIRQTLPPEIESDAPVTGVPWAIMHATITDYPRYGYRGVMLDVARKWFPKEEIMRQIDLLAQYKLNVVRLHLTEDQGFRIALDGYPELTEIGPHMKDVSQGSYNGANVTGNQSRLIPGSIHYGATPGQLSKEDFAEILAYADERFVTVIPEIEFPSHNYAMQVSLPMLREGGQLPDAALSGGGAFWTDAVGQAYSVNPTGTSKSAKYTKAFIEDVFTQISDMLYGRHQYIHVGGDESHTQSVSDFYDVTKLAIETVENNGKISMQWAMTSARSYDHYWADIFQSWNNGSAGVQDAARPLAAGKKVLVSTANQLYIDHFTSNAMPMGHSWAARSGVPVSTVFNTNPEERVPEAYRNQGNVVGVESPVWAETYGTRQMLDLLIYPRAAALAEIGWSPDEIRSGTGAGSAWAESFQPRLAAQGDRYTYQGVTFANEPSVWPSQTVTIRTENGNYNAPVVLPMNGALEGRFDFDGVSVGNQPVRVKKVSEPSQGTVTLDENGNWQYTPTQGFVGRDAFTVGFQVDGYGIPLGPTTSSGRGTATFNGYRTVYLNVTNDGDETLAVNMTKLAARPTNIRVSMNPPVPGLLKENFVIDGGITVRMAETFDNGGTYLLVTTPRNDNETHTLSVVNKTGYTFNEIPMVSHNIIPKPVSFVGDSANFIVKENTRIIVAADGENEEAALSVAAYLADIMRTSTGYDLPVVTEGAVGMRDISMALIPADEELAEGVGFETAGIEGYALHIGVDGAFLTAYTTEGLFRGVSTIRQLLPPEIEKDTLVTDTDWVMTYASIYDYPRYEYRSVMLDSARHFRTKEETMRQIDVMSQYKINVLHMHMTDNEGFRIAFDEYPEVTAFGGETKNFRSLAAAVPGSTNRAYPGSINDGATGYYTQQDYKDIVAYAQSKYVQIVPEIEFPGHSVAQLFSLPELSGAASGGGMAPYRDGLQGNGSNSNRFINDPDQNPFTAKYIDDIMEKLAEMTPGKYIHMGGDEVYQMGVQDYTDASEYVLDAIGRTGKLSIQWVQDNAGANNYPAPDIIQNWKNSYDSWTFVHPAVEAGAKVIANLSDHTYFDHPTDRTMPLGASWGKSSPQGSTVLLTTPFAYQWDPEQATMRRVGNGASATWEPTGYEDQIIGVEACLWSETIGSESAVDILLYPRVQGLAEIGWSPKEDRAIYTASNPSAMQADLTKPSWINHRERLAAQGARMAYQGVDFMNDPFVWPEKEINVTEKRFDITTPMDTPVSGKIEFSAADSLDKAVIRKASEPSQGIVTLEEDGAWTYTPTEGFVGADSFVVSFSTEGFGIPMGTESGERASGTTDDYNGFAKVYLTVLNTAETGIDVDVTVKAVSKDNITVALNPPVPGMRATPEGSENFAIEGIAVRYAETYDNGSTYVLITEPRADGETVELAITKPGYVFESAEVRHDYTTNVHFTQGGESLTADFDLRYYTDRALNLQFILAVYDENGVLNDVRAEEVTLDPFTFYHGTAITLPFAAGQTAQAFLWDGQTGAPLCGAFEYAEVDS